MACGVRFCCIENLMKVVSKSTNAHKRTTTNQLNLFAPRVYCPDDASCVYKKGKNTTQCTMPGKSATALFQCSDFYAFSHCDESCL